MPRLAYLPGPGYHGHDRDEFVSVYLFVTMYLIFQLVYLAFCIEVLGIWEYVFRTWECVFGF